MFSFRNKFDFKISIDEYIVTAAPGQQIKIPIKIKLIRGKPQNIKLSVSTHWESAGLTANIIPSTIFPIQEEVQAMIIINVSGRTKPDSYLFAARGETKGTFSTSEDTVTVIVGPKDKQQKSDTQDNFQNNNILSNDIDEPSFSLDNLFIPKGMDQDSLTRSSGSKTSSDKNNKAGDSATTWIAVSIFIGIIIAIIISVSNDGSGNVEGNGCPITPICYGGMPSTCKCPASCPKRKILTNPMPGRPSTKGFVQCER